MIRMGWLTTHTYNVSICSRYIGGCFWARVICREEGGSIHFVVFYFMNFYHQFMLYVAASTYKEELKCSIVWNGWIRRRERKIEKESGDMDQRKVHSTAIEGGSSYDISVYCYMQWNSICLWIFHSLFQFELKLFLIADLFCQLLRQRRGL